MSVKIVADSSCNIRKTYDGLFSSVPLSIVAGEKYFYDNSNLNIAEMLEFFDSYKSKSGTACPAPGEWISAFDGSDEVICITLTGKLSGGYNSAMTAADIYMQDNPEKKVFVMDSLSTGPELQLLVEKAVELSRAGCSFEGIKEQLTEYATHTHLAFSLARLKNFAANGRVNKALAESIKLLHIKIVGRASDEGDLEPQNKCRGEKNAIATLWGNMIEAGFSGGKVRISHTANPELAKMLAHAIVKNYPECNVKILENKGICSYYAEPGSVLVGYET